MQEKAPKSQDIQVQRKEVRPEVCWDLEAHDGSTLQYPQAYVENTQHN